MLGIPSRCHIRSNTERARERERCRESEWSRSAGLRCTGHGCLPDSDACQVKHVIHNVFASMRQEKSFPASAGWDAGGRHQLQALPVCVIQGWWSGISGYVICCWAANYTLCNFHPPSQTWGKWWCVLYNYTWGMNIRDANTRCNLLMNGNALLMTCTELSVGLLITSFVIRD